MELFNTVAGILFCFWFTIKISDKQGICICMSKRERERGTVCSLFHVLSVLTVNRFQMIHQCEENSLELNIAR